VSDVELAVALCRGAQVGIEGFGVRWPAAGMVVERMGWDAELAALDPPTA
jgi:hypothetical protein